MGIKILEKLNSREVVNLGLRFGDIVRYRAITGAGFIREPWRLGPPNSDLVGNGSLLSDQDGYIGGGR